jgi:lysozyme family protein
MADFQPALEVILKHEGGWVDDPADRGGETNFGISTKIIEDEKLTNVELGLPEGRTRGWLKAMHVNAAIHVYKKLFWDRFSYGQINDQTVATKICDAAVNMGGTQAAVLAQRAATACGQPAADDGKLGPRSFAAINACIPSEFLVQMKAQMEKFYDSIIKNRPANEKFRKNWMRRAGWGVP